MTSEFLLGQGPHTNWCPIRDSVSLPVAAVVFFLLSFLVPACLLFQGRTLHLPAVISVPPAVQCHRSEQRRLWFLQGNGGQGHSLLRSLFFLDVLEKYIKFLIEVNLIGQKMFTLLESFDLGIFRSKSFFQTVS